MTCDQRASSWTNNNFEVDLFFLSVDVIVLYYDVVVNICELIIDFKMKKIEVGDFC